MANKGKVTAKDATEAQKGVSLFADYAESIAGQIDNKFVSPKNILAVINNSLSGIKFKGFDFHLFEGFVQLQPNGIYVTTSPSINPPFESKLPARGIGQKGDLILVYALTADLSFKVTMNTDLILHHDGKSYEDIDNRILLGDKGGSCVLLGCGGTQQWYSYFHYQITLGVNT